MICISFNRETVSPKDEAESCAQRITLDDGAVLYDLIAAVIRGGCGNARPIPHTDEEAHWAIRSDIGVLAYYSVNGPYGSLDYPNYAPEMQLKDSEIWSVFASRVRGDETGRR